jgi:hypothetical protein
MDQHNNEDCAAQRELEAMHTVDTSGPPRLVAVEEPVERYFKDEGGTSKVLFFGFELHGEITRGLRELADSSSRVPLTCELMYEDMTPVEPKDDDGKDMYLVLGGMEPESDRPTLNLLARCGGVRYHINKVSMRRDGKKYRMRVSIRTPSGAVLPAIQPVISIPTYVASKRSGRNKLEKADDSLRRINRLRLRKEQLAASLSRKNKDMVGEVLFRYNGTPAGAGTASGNGGSNNGRIPIVGMPVPAQLRLPPAATGSYPSGSQPAQTQQRYAGGKRPISSMMAAQQDETIKRSKATASDTHSQPLSPPTACSQQAKARKNKSITHQKTSPKTPTLAELANIVNGMSARILSLEIDNRALWKANTELTTKVTALTSRRPYPIDLHRHHRSDMLLSSDSEDENDQSSTAAPAQPGSGSDNAMMPMLPLSRSWSNDSGRLVSMIGNGTGDNGYESEVPIFDMLVGLPDDNGFGPASNNENNGSSRGGGAVIHAVNNNHNNNNHNPLNKPPALPVRQFSLSSLPADEGDPIA